MSFQEINEFLEKENKCMEALYNPVLFNNWMSATTGNKEWSERHEKSLSDYFANFSGQEKFKRLLSFREEKNLTPIQVRQLDDLYNKIIKNQLDKSILGKTKKRGIINVLCKCRRSSV